MRANSMRLSAAILMLSAVTVSAGEAKRPAPEMKNGKPVYEVCSFIVAPGTLREMYDRSDAVMDVRIIASTGKVVAGQRPRTFYTANVLHVFKGESNQTPPVVFSQAAGEVELPDKILRSNDTHTLTVGERYVVFLRRHEPYGGYILTGEREGAFKILNGRIEPQGTLAVAHEQRELTERQFNDELDMLARRAGPKPQ